MSVMHSFQSILLFKILKTAQIFSYRSRYDTVTAVRPKIHNLKVPGKSN